MTADDDIEARILASVKGCDTADVFSALATIWAKMVLDASHGDATEVSRMFRECADHWDQTCRGTQH